MSKKMSITKRKLLGVAVCVCLFVEHSGRYMGLDWLRVTRSFASGGFL